MILLNTYYNKNDRCLCHYLVLVLRCVCVYVCLFLCYKSEQERCMYTSTLLPQLPWSTLSQHILTDSSILLTCSNLLNPSQSCFIIPYSLFCTLHAKCPPLVGNKATWLCQQPIRICSNILYHKNLISHTVISQKPSLKDTRCLKPLQRNTTRMVEGTAVVLGLCFYRGSSVSKAIWLCTSTENLCNKAIDIAGQSSLQSCCFCSKWTVTPVAKPIENNT